MVYTELTNKAMKIAYDAHHGQFDKGGIPYIYHPIHLAEQMDDEVECVCALLHDVVEDTDITFEDLEKDLNYRPQYDLKKGVEESIKWYKNEKWL